MILYVIHVIIDREVQVPQTTFQEPALTSALMFLSHCLCDVVVLLQPEFPVKMEVYFGEEKNVCMLSTVN